MSFANTSGVNAMDLRVIVKQDGIAKKIGSIHLPDQEVDKLKFAGQKGTLISVGENAFEEAKARSPVFVRPAPGDRVMFTLYGGTKFKGADGEEYLFMNDADILGRLEE
ncbi:co-chaperone GroES [Sphingopyxis sp. JAI128]|uniref:co-chaperone GroES n=1 Tax=Sphingopyxis sp. JAI128 TaxID=2723066 RepID=UPI00160E3219|nr:co-chaperone GroES [Sphingopyxis sp. JAI128]MBB6424955.1 co-chaperonin GroES (HSP10) [Sphingopyxis sp. JAI128]